MLPDIKTLIMVYLIVNVISTGAVAVIWGQNRRRFAGIPFWLVGLALQAAGAALIVLRGLAPDIISMTLANTMIMAGLLITLKGLERFTGKKGWQIYNYILLAIFVAVSAYFAVVQPNLVAREITLSAVAMVYTFQCCWLLLRRVDPGMRQITGLTGSIFAIYAASTFARIILIIIIPEQSNDFFKSGAVSALTITVYIVLSICLAISLVLMVNRRLLADVISQEQKFAAAFNSSPYAITLTRPSDGRIFEVNNGFVNITGYQYAEVIGKTTVDLKLWANEKNRLAVVSELARGREVNAVEYQFRKRTGEIITGLFSANLITVNNETCILSSIGDISERKLTEEKLAKSYESVKKTLNDAIDTIAKIVETRDPYTAGHQRKVAELAVAIGSEMKLEDALIDQIRMAATIHDIGKMYVPSDILSKPGKLSDIEFSLIKTHSQGGYNIVKDMDFPCVVAQAILQHHERLDGSGYPNGLKGEDTLLEAKILAVADVVEAMVSHRPYRPALGVDKALEEISKNKGKLYDPQVVDTCLELFKSSEFQFKTV
jgi:PAS domain S-box-containing protein/putative nucleotidyltransferase with HDIG domain